MDKFLGAVKDFSSIKRYLAAINQTTDDYLVALDISTGIIQFFGPIKEHFNIGVSEDNSVPLDDFLAIVHPADRKALREDIEKVSRGEKQSHDMDFRMFNLRAETIWVNSRGKVLHDEKGSPHIMIGRLSEEAVRHLFNPLTGLWNKTKLRQDLEKRLYCGKGWLMMIGIPSLSDINLSYGRDFGNQLLCDIANAFEEMELIEESYHTEQNNFALVISECDEKKVESIYERVSLAMNGKASVCAGVVPIDKSVFMDVSQIIDSANVTLKGALQNMMGQILFFSSDDIGKRINEIKLLEELKESVQNGFEGFDVFYQPQIKRGNYELYGIEALLRYNSKERGRVFPDEFIPILEQSGLIDPVGMWVLDMSLQQCKKWRESLPDLQVAVNFSSVQFDDRRLGEKIIDALKRADLPGEALTVELTESIQLSGNKQYYEIIKYVKSHGVRFSIDDFGTGYSNLGYLKQLIRRAVGFDRGMYSVACKLAKHRQKLILIKSCLSARKGNAATRKEHHTAANSLFYYVRDRKLGTTAVGIKAFGIGAPSATHITAPQMINQSVTGSVLRKIKPLLKYPHTYHSITVMVCSP